MSFPAKLLNEGERVVVSTRTHPKALAVPLLVLVIGGLLLTFIGMWATGLSNDGLATGIGVVCGVVSVLVLVRYVLIPFVAWLTTTYTFTNRRFIKRSGFISKEGRTIPLNRISGVDFEMGVVDRIFRCGTLVVSDASAEGRVELNDIPRVEHVQLLVAEELHQLSQHGRNDDGT
ncbi:PH domain-containing protein [Nocardioides gilvus]|uniref:PH domain-containing protein n=1 Tax=Nocardioides gilvus TaxID=1735589 RepID=UPI000D750698|nr:PH domain-containing protein [Nocardioides gilvus]